MPSNERIINFSGKNRIDKIVYSDDSLTYTVPNGTESDPIITNPVGFRCLITLAWSVDGINYYPAQALVNASNAFAVNAWCSDTQIGFILQNFSGATVTFRLTYALDTVS